MSFFKGRCGMQYVDVQTGKLLETLDKFLCKGEKHEDLIHSGDACWHVWEHCVHIGLGSIGSHKSCVTFSNFREYHHDVCKICGKNRFFDEWLVAAEKILENRRDAVRIAA